MAKFQQPYVLCPLIGQRSILGVANDVESDCVIVTLGKNMILRYKLQNQKQVDSWATRDKLTSPVIYDAVGVQYVGVFAYTQLRLWPDTQERLEDVKKHRFQARIHCVLAGVDEAGPVVVFESGAAMPLTTALETRRSTAVPELLGPGEVIHDCCLVVHEGIKQVALLTRTAKGRVWCCLAPVSEDWLSHRFEVTCSDNVDATLAGHAFVSDGNICRLFSLWSDGRLLVQPTVAGADKELLAVLTAVSTANPVSMLPLGPSQLALYGADPSEEGAALVVYNVRFGLVQCQQHLKLFSAPPALWRCGERLLLPLGSSLLVVPYSLEAERLAAVLGSHRPVQQHDADVQLVTQLCEVSWASGPMPVPDPAPAQEAVPAALAGCLQQLEAAGRPQAMILEEVVPELLAAEEQHAVLWCLQHHADVPERSLVDVLKFCLRHNAADTLLDVALAVGFSEERMVAEVRRLTLDDALELVRRLLEPRAGVEVAVALRWLSLLLDTHYQQYLLARDQHVTAILAQAQDFVSMQIAHVLDMKSMLPLIQAMSSGKSTYQNQRIGKLYYIERISLW